MREFKTEKETGGEIRECLYTAQHRPSLLPSLMGNNKMYHSDFREWGRRGLEWEENSVNKSIMSYCYTYFMVLESTMCCWLLTSNPLGVAEWAENCSCCLANRCISSKVAPLATRGKIRP
jgi:hypothetical protein